MDKKRLLELAGVNEDEEYNRAVRYLAQVASMRALEKWEEEPDYITDLYGSISDYAEEVFDDQIATDVKEIIEKTTRRQEIGRKRQRGNGR